MEDEVVIKPSRLYRGNPLIHSTVVFRRVVWERVGGYDDELTICVDYDFIVRVMQFGNITRCRNQPYFI